MSTSWADAMEANEYVSDDDVDTFVYEHEQKAAAAAAAKRTPVKKATHLFEYSTKKPASSTAAVAIPKAPASAATRARTRELEDKLQKKQTHILAILSELKRIVFYSRLDVSDVDYARELCNGLIITSLPLDVCNANDIKSALHFFIDRLHAESTAVAASLNDLYTSIDDAEAEAFHRNALKSYMPYQPRLVLSS
jgi:hypothetical protein